MQVLEEIDLGDADVAVRPVKIDGQRYVLRELSYEAESKRTAFVRRNGVFGEDGRLESYKEGYSHLDTVKATLALCMFKNIAPVPVNGEAVQPVCGDPVPEEVLKAWPSELVFKLNDMLTELCPTLRGLDTVEGIEKEIARLAKRLDELNGKDAAKNSPSAATEPSAQPAS